jgi:hypothetical protein
MTKSKEVVANEIKSKKAYNRIIRYFKLTWPTILSAGILAALITSIGAWLVMINQQHIAKEQESLNALINSNQMLLTKIAQLQSTASNTFDSLGDVVLAFDNGNEENIKNAISNCSSKFMLFGSTFNELSIYGIHIDILMEGDFMVTFIRDLNKITPENEFGHFIPPRPDRLREIASLAPDKAKITMHELYLEIMKSKPNNVVLANIFSESINKVGNTIRSKLGLQEVQLEGTAVGSRYKL